MNTRCDMKRDCTNPVTHIGEKGYIYCATHAVSRRQSGYERTRRMRAWELEYIRVGKPLPSYQVSAKPKLQEAASCESQGK